MNRFLLNLLLVIVSPVQLALAGEPAKAIPTAGEFAIDMVADTPKLYAIVCTAKNPAMKADFDQVIAEFRAKVEKIAKPLLASDLFDSLNHDHPPQELIDMIQEQHKAQREQIKDADPSKDCPVFLANFRKADNELLKAGITQSLAGMQAAITGIKKGIFK